MWEYVLAILNKYGLAASLVLIIGGGLTWFAYQAYKESISYKEREQNERFSQARETNAHIRQQQKESIDAINAVHETLTLLLAKVELLEREIHDNVDTDNSQNLSLNSIVKDLPKHAQDCATANSKLIEELPKMEAKIQLEVVNANSKLLEELHKIHLEIVACKTILDGKK